MRLGQISLPLDMIHDGVIDLYDRHRCSISLSGPRVLSVVLLQYLLLTDLSRPPMQWQPVGCQSLVVGYFSIGWHGHLAGNGLLMPTC